MMRRLWGLCPRLKRRCEDQGRTGGIVGDAVMAVVAMAISKQPVHFGSIKSGALLLVVQVLPLEGEHVEARLTGVCPR